MGIFYRIKNRIHNYKLNHMNLGRAKRKNGKLRIEKIPWDIHWQTNRYIALIVRDYLRFFAENTPAIGNVPEVEGLDGDAAYKVWIDKILSVAQEFDNLLSLIEKLDLYDDSDERLDSWQIEDLFKQKQETTNRAFDCLREIFSELSW